MKYTFSILAIALAFASCKTQKTAAKMSESVLQEKTESSNPKLIKLWETDSVLTMCESALYDEEKSLIYVSNINKGPWEEDGDGFISTVDTLGNVLNLKWVEGLDGPKGMALVQQKLYTSDIDELLEIDTHTQQLTNRYKIEGTPFLNDVTAAADGTVYVSGIQSNAIYALKNGVTEQVTQQDFKSLNGILHDPDGIYYLTSEGHKFGIYNEATKTTKTLTENIRTGDGIVKLPNGDFLTSDWKGSIFYISATTWSKQLLLDTTAEEINAADISYIPELNMLLVPTFFHNTLAAYRLVFEKE